MVLKPVYRITTFIPREHLDKLIQGILQVVPLKWGKYDRVAWISEGVTEQYRPLPGSNPVLGKAGELERATSVRLELVIPRDPALLERVLTEGVIPHHLWEEPAVFIEESLATLTQPQDG